MIKLNKMQTKQKLLFITIKYHSVMYSGESDGAITLCLYPYWESYGKNMLDSVDGDLTCDL